MKNEKFCFSKGTGLIAIVGILLVGFVIANQTLTDTKTSTNSRASAANGNALGGGGGTPPTPAGTLILADLIKKADAAITAMKSTIAGCAVQTNGANCATAETKYNDLTKKRLTANETYSLLTGTVNPDTQFVPSEGKIPARLLDFNSYVMGISTKKIASTKDLNDAIAKVTSTKASWDAAIAITKAAEESVQDQTRIYAASFGLFYTSLNTFSGTMQSLNNDIARNTVNELATLKSQNINASNTDFMTYRGALLFAQYDGVISTKDPQTGKSKIDQLESTFLRKDKQIFRDSYNSFHTNLTKAVADRAKLDAYKGVVTSAKTSEAAKKLEYDTAIAAREKAVNIDAVYGEMSVNLLTANTALKSLVISKEAVLPAGPSALPVLLTANLYSVDTSVYTSAQMALDSVNKVLADANIVYEKLQNVTGVSASEVVSQASAYNDYCASIKPYRKDGVLIQKFWPVINPELTVYDTQGKLVGLASNIANFYYGTECNKNAADFKWNGIWGAGAKCYTATGVCSTQNNCVTTDCIAELGNGTKCIYREVPVENCNPDLLANKTLTCATSGVYFKAGGEYYETNGLREANGRKYCGSKKVTGATEIAAAQAYIASTIANKVAAKDRDCKVSAIFKRDNNRTKLEIAYANLLGQPYAAGTDSYGSFKPGMVCYHMSARSNSTGTDCLNELATDATGKYSANLCDCQTEIDRQALTSSTADDTTSIQLMDGVYKCVGSQYFSN